MLWCYSLVVSVECLGGIDFMSDNEQRQELNNNKHDEFEDYKSIQKDGYGSDNGLETVQEGLDFWGLINNSRSNKK